MTKQDFLLTMQNALCGMHRADLEKTLQYYREMIEDRMEEGMSEASAVADVGDPIELAAAIRGKPVAQTAIRTAGEPRPPKGQRPPKAPKERKPMSAGKRASLIIVACLLAAAGLGLVGSGAVRAVAAFSGGSSAMKEYTFASGDIRSLEIEAGAAEVALVPVSDGICRVKCSESLNQKYKVWLNEGTLHVERESRWSLFRFSLKEDVLRICLPERSYESIWLKASSGSISIPEDFRFRTAILSASSGGIGFFADVTEELNLHSSSGGISVSGTSPSELIVTVSSGGIALSDANPGSVTLHSSSGGMRVSNLHCTSLSAECSSGSIRFSDVIADGKLTVDCSSGSIRLDDCDAAELSIECTSGSVSGHLLTPKIWSASSVSGSVRVPESGGGGLCVVKATSGSIRFD